MRNIIAVLLIVVVVVLVININSDENDRPSHNNGDESRGDRIAAVLEDAWDEFGLFSFGIGKTDPTISIVMDDTKSEVQLKKYIEENINKTDLNHYNIEITKRSLQEVETEWFMGQVSGLVSDYIHEKNYDEVAVSHPSIDPEPILKITIPEYSELSSEILKTELDDLLVSKSSELPKNDISYEIQVIKSTLKIPIESDAVISDVVEDFQGTADDLISSSTDIFKGNGIYKMSWGQRLDSKGYKFHVTNNTGTNVTVQIQQGVTRNRIM